MNELKLVTSKDKLKKYFEAEKVADLISLLGVISEKVKLNRIDQICRDPKDDFLLALTNESKADYFITGDKDLLELKFHGRTEILTLKKFKARIS